jgi:transposase
MNNPMRYSSDFLERAVRMLLEQQDQYDSQWAAMNSIAAKVGCTAQTLRKCVRQAEQDLAIRNGVTSDERERLKELERENCELKRANELQRNASA